MPRSSFSRNPLLRVSRPISACSRCRTAKVKCDGKLPACTACQKAGREDECSSANDQFARGKERSYVAALELRIEKLERRLDYAKSRKESVGNYESETVSPESTDRRDSLAYIRDAIHRKAAKTRENSDVNTLVSDFGFMSVNATTRDFELGANSMTFARLVLAATLREPVPPSVEINLPPKQVVNSIIQYFMSNIYTLFPCFSETAILTIADEIYQQDQRAIRDTDYWLFYMVLAIASTSQSTTIHDAYYDNGVEYLAKALKHGDRALVPGTVAQVQCLLLLTIYSMLDPAHFDSWHLIGVTARAVVDLGLHQDPPSSSVPDRSVMDMRRRVFYSVYALDRAVSMVHARTFSFTDENVNVAFPTALSGSRKSSDSAAISGPQSADPALLLFQLRRAQSYWYQELYQSDPTPLLDPTSFLWQMCQDMREWGDSLPESLPVGIRRMFEQELRYSYVYCIAPSVRAPQITDYTRTLIFEYSIEYLNAMHEIAHSGLNSAFYTYHDALKVYFMGNQLLAVLRDAEDILLSGRPVPVPPAQPGCPIPPPTPKRPAQPNNNAAQDAVQRGLWCLERVPQTFSKYGERWEESKLLLGSFQQQSSEVLNRLRQRQTVNQSPVMQQQILQQQQQQQQQQQRQQQLQAQLGQYQTGVPSNAYDNSQQPWVGINVSQMMHGGPHR